MEEIDPGYAKHLVNRGKESYDKQDFTQAKKYFKKACDLKEGWGCFNLGALYYIMGKEWKRTLKKPFNFFLKLAI
ncbi:hypothetical protein COL0002_07180 [Helicobacter pylori]